MEKQKTDEQNKKTIKSIAIGRNIIIICNILAAIFIGSIYFQFKNVIFIIIGLVLLLINFPIFILLRKIGNNFTKEN